MSTFLVKLKNHARTIRDYVLIAMKINVGTMLHFLKNIILSSGLQ